MRFWGTKISNSSKGFSFLYLVNFETTPLVAVATRDFYYSTCSPPHLPKISCIRSKNASILLGNRNACFP